MQRLAIVDLAGVVQRVIVVPDVADPVAYGRNLGLTDILVPCDEISDQVGDLFAPGDPVPPDVPFDLAAELAAIEDVPPSTLE